MGKTLQELTIMDNWMFGAVMLDPEICRGLLERALDLKIDRVEVLREKSLVYNPQYKGVRLDVYAKDDKDTCFNVEMQVRTTPVAKRSRYYHSQIDMEQLQTGKSYKELGDSYVIFITNYDPFEQGKYRYTFENICQEISGFPLGDGAHTIILNNKGNNPEEVSPELLAFLEYTKSDSAESATASDDEYVRELKNSIRKIKASREMGGLYMTLQEMLKEEREEGHKEGLKEGLKKGDKKGRLEERKAMIPEILAEKNISIESIEKKLDEINDIDLLKSLTIAAVSAKNAEDFLTSLEAIQE